MCRLARNYWVSTYRAATYFKLWQITNNMKIISTILSLRIFSCWSEQSRHRENAGVQLGELSSNQRTRTRVFPTLHHSPTSISLHVRHLSLHNPLSAPYMCLCSLIKVIEWKHRSLTCVRWICLHVQLPCMLVTLITQVSWPHHGISFLWVALNYDSFTEIPRCLQSLFIEEVPEKLRNINIYERFVSNVWFEVHMELEVNVTALWCVALCR
jgi:hypothetical protein